MVRVTCLSPTKSYSYCSSAFAHLELLIFKSSNGDPSTRNNQRATIQSKQQLQLRTIHQNEKKGLKRTYRKIGLVATVTRTQETQKMELRLKRYNYRKICVIKETKELYFIYFN